MPSFTKIKKYNYKRFEFYKNWGNATIVHERHGKIFKLEKKSSASCHANNHAIVYASSLQLFGISEFMSASSSKRV